MRQRLLALVQARLERFGVDHDPATILDPAAVAEVQALLDTVPDLAADLEVAHLAGLLHWLRYQLMAVGDDQEDLAAALTCFAPVYQVRPDAIPDTVRAHFDRDRPSSPGDLLALVSRAITLLETGDSAALNIAIDLLRQAVAATPADHPDRGAMLSNLGGALRARFERTGDPADLDAAIEVGQQAVAASPDRPPRPRCDAVQPRRRPAGPV